MTPCEYRHDCWHEDTCHARETPLVKPACWMQKGEGWKATPKDGWFDQFVDNVITTFEKEKDIPKGILKTPFNKEYVNNTLALIEKSKESDQGELF
jgi:hypothetical protein